MYTIQEQRALLSQKNKVGYIYVYPGFNVYLQKVSVNDTNISIEELAFICIKSGKGMFINENDLTEEVDKNMIKVTYIFIVICLALD